MNVYNPNTPQITDPYSIWQKNFQSNFTVTSDSFKKNHIALESAGQGNHTIVQLLETSTSTKYQTNVGEFAVYCRNNPEQTDQVFMQYQGNGIEFQYTNYQIYRIGVTQFQSSYFSYLPGNIIIYFGSVPNISSGEAVIQLNPPIVKNVISINLTSNGVLGSDTMPTTGLISNDKYITGIYLKSPFLPQIQSLYYTVMANI